jgi:hypothetical protein
VPFGRVGKAHQSETADRLPVRHSAGLPRAYRAVASLETDRKWLFGFVGKTFREADYGNTKRCTQIYSLERVESESRPATNTFP